VPCGSSQAALIFLGVTLPYGIPLAGFPWRQLTFSDQKAVRDVRCGICQATPNLDRLSALPGSRIWSAGGRSFRKFQNPHASLRMTFWTLQSVAHTATLTRKFRARTAEPPWNAGRRRFREISEPARQSPHDILESPIRRPYGNSKLGNSEATWPPSHDALARRHRSPHGSLPMERFQENFRTPMAVSP
jgi:hypothetical protein